MKKSKRGQVLGLSFGMIFSIILIIVFVVATFYVIRFFLVRQSCTNAGVFYRDLQQQTDEIWNSEGAAKTFSGTLPSKVTWVCFINFTGVKDSTGLTTEEKQIASKAYSELYGFRTKKANVFMYPYNSVCPEFSYTMISHIELKTNPKCYKVTDGKVTIKLSRGISDAFVKIS